MKRFLLIGLLAFPFVYAEAQNLVPNPSFEDTLLNPIWNGILNNECANWYGPLPGSTDHNDDRNPFCPGCASSVHLPRTGFAYAGIFTYDMRVAQEREALSIQLLDTLKAGQKYCVEFYVSRGYFNNYNCNNIGAYFSNQPIPNSNVVTTYIPQVQNPINNQLFDKVNWILVSGSFIAQGNETFLTIANFTPDSQCDISYVGDGFQGDSTAYYFIEDVSVYACEDSASLSIPNVFTPNGDGINDEFHVQGVALKNYRCEIFDRWGALIFSSTDINRNWDGWNTSGSPCTNGTYYYVVQGTGEDQKDYLLKGFITLIR
jgi:gliding motility-associated-like protein